MNSFTLLRMPANGHSSILIEYFTPFAGILFSYQCFSLLYFCSLNLIQKYYILQIVPVLALQKLVVLPY